MNIPTPLEIMTALDKARKGEPDPRLPAVFALDFYVDGEGQNCTSQQFICADGRVLSKDGYRRELLKILTTQENKTNE